MGLEAFELKGIEHRQPAQGLGSDVFSHQREYALQLLKKCCYLLPLFSNLGFGDQCVRNDLFE